MSKGGAIWVMIFMLMMICGIFVGKTNANILKYGPIRAGSVPPDCKLHPDAPACHESPANGYVRGCEKETNCRPHDKP